MRTIRSGTAATMLAAGLLLAAGGTAAAQDSDITAGASESLQDAAERFGDGVNDVRIGLVNVQDVSNANEVPINALNQNQITSFTGDQGETGASSADVSD